jgi:DNA-binding response OmpR family regulator
MKLSKSEQKVYDYLATADGDWVDMTELYMVLYQPEPEIASPDACLKVFVYRIRKKLPEGQRIECGRRRYRLVTNA